MTSKKQPIADNPQRPVPGNMIEALECKHATYTYDRDSGDDLLTIKEVIHTTDGREIPNLFFIKNYKKDFYITKEGHRTKEDQKKEWEDLSKLQKFSSTQGKLALNIAKALGRPGAKGGLRRLGRSPHLYGSDISTPTLIKQTYQKRFDNKFSNNRVAVLDIETDVVNGTEEPIYVTISFKDKIVTTVTKWFAESIPNFEEKLEAKANELLGELIEQRNIKFDIKVCDNAGIACAEAIKKAHEWKPDFLTVWNIDFDIPRINDTLHKYGLDPAEVFSDPTVPKRFKEFKYIKGRTQKVTASGTVSSIHPADRWHVASCPASFHLIDSMCVYKRIRIAAKNESSYSLDNLLNKHLGMRKLKFTETDGLSGLDWHVEMQKNYKLEYGVYNMFDCIGVELFDEKVGDLATSISVQCGYSDYKIFDSQPKRLIDQLYFYVQGHGKVVGVVSDNMEEALDKYVVGMRDWIITLPSHLRVENGQKVVKEIPDLRTMIFFHNADLDVSAAYPSTEVLLNISKETTHRELGAIKGIDEMVKRFATINMSASHVNAVEIANDIYSAPKLDDLLTKFKATHC